MPRKNRTHLYRPDSTIQRTVCGLLPHDTHAEPFDILSDPDDFNALGTAAQCGNCDRIGAVTSILAYYCTECRQYTHASDTPPCPSTQCERRRRLRRLYFCNCSFHVEDDPPVWLSRNQLAAVHLSG